MRRKILLTWCAWALVIGAFGQIKKQFSVEEAPSCKEIRLSLKANSGNCLIKPSQQTDILNVFSNQTERHYSHSFRKEIIGDVCEVSLDLEEVQSEGFGQTISTRFFSSGSSRPGNKIWKMYLTESKPYSLELNYGIGNANVDLSGLSIKRLKINTASADVVIGYFSALENQIEMDTFFVKVDVGSVNVQNLSLAKTKNIFADVGFGNMILDFADQPIRGTRIKGSVGAGNLIIALPPPNVPVLVKIKDSWLCSVKMPSGMKKISENTFANAAYERSTRNALLFDLDVSLGNITFKEPQN